MKMFLCAHNPTKNQVDHICARLREFTESYTCILVGESPQDKDRAMSLLVEEGYPSVILYSLAEEPQLPVGTWGVQKVVRQAGWAGHNRSAPFCYDDFNRGREVVKAMAMEADRGLVFWDGNSLDTFAAMLYMVILGKPVEVVLSDGRVEEVRSFDGLRGLFPARNPRHRPWNASIPMQDQRMVAERFIPSELIAGQFAVDLFEKWEIVHVILGSPTSLQAKLEALVSLSQYDDLLHEISDEVEWRLDGAKKYEAPEDKLLRAASGWNAAVYGSFSVHCDAIGEALVALRETGPGEIFYRKTFHGKLVDCRCHRHGECIAPFSNFDAALDNLRFEMAQYGWVEGCGLSPCWSAFEKWRLTSSGTWENVFTYYAINDEIVFFNRFFCDEEKGDWLIEDGFYGGSFLPDLNIRVPVEVGDVITLDCRPFAPVRHALVLEAECQTHIDFSMPRVLFLEGDEVERMKASRWTISSPKHAFGLHLSMPGYSPLYRLELYDEPLPAHEILIDEVRAWLHDDSSVGMRMSGFYGKDITSEEIMRDRWRG